MVTLQPAYSGSVLSSPANPSANANPTLSSQEFTKALSDAIAGTLERFGIDPHSVTIDLGSSVAQDARQNSVPSQLSASIVSPAGASALLATVANATPFASSAVVGFNALVPKDTPIQPAAPAPSRPAAQHWYASDPVADAYWSKQSPAVQQLREIDDYGQRQALGAKLASQGYQIDVPIMVWGWDAGKTTDLRKGFGYTWVPSALQASVSAAPGLTGAGIVPYDPGHPPQGSMTV